MKKLRLGLIINPIAGMGGRVGLKGTDGQHILNLALEKGAVPRSEERAALCFSQLRALSEQFDILTGAGHMGEFVLRSCGFAPTILCTQTNLFPRTTAEDTLEIARQMVANSVDIIVFSGGDGTARNIFSVVHDTLPVLGIPAGVKIHSAVFATSPTGASLVLKGLISGKKMGEKLAEVMDIDESAYRDGFLKASLYGYLRIPYERGKVQGLKAGSPISDRVAQEAIATTVSEMMDSNPDTLFLLGAGSTTQAIASKLGKKGTLLGVDAYLGDCLVARDLCEHDLLLILSKHVKKKLLLTPIGGQGFILGRGNQQISPEVLQKIGKENLIIVSTVSKLHALYGSPLLLDTGNGELDSEFEGIYKVITHYNQHAYYRVKRG